MLDALPTKTALGFRRSRFAPRQPLAQRIERTPTLDAIEAALSRHPVLPATYLFRFTQNKSYSRFQDLLTTLYNGTTDGVYYLDRPTAQFNNMNARYQPFVYSLPRAKKGGWFVHQLMGSCISASMELACKDIEYIHRNTVLAIKDSVMVLHIGREQLVPDDLAAIGYQDNTTLPFVREDDRGTESIRGASLDATYAGKKLLAYIKAMRAKAYKDVWGVSRLKLLFATVDEARKESLKALVYKEAPDLGKDILFKVFPEFGKHWRIPPVYEDIMQWEAADGSFFDLSIPRKK